MRYQGLLVSAATVAALAGCGKSSDSDSGSSGNLDASSANAGFAFAMIDEGFTSSTLVYDDLLTGKIKTLSSGESGDPVVTWLGERLYLFNRSSTSLNFRTLDPRQPDAPLSAQVVPGGANAGDPHGTVLLDAGRLLIANYVAGNIAVVDPTTGALLQKVEADWDIGDAATTHFRPEAFFVHALADGTREIYVTHQGVDNTTFASNGQQRIFVLKDDGKTVTAVDLDPAKDKVQGIAADVTIPGPFFRSDTDDAVLYYGQCTAFAAADCKQGVAKLTFATRTSELVFDTTSIGKDNGGIIQGAGHDLYELMVKADGKTAVVTKLDYAAKTNADVYTLNTAAGTDLLAFDASAATLYVGDYDSAKQKGVLAVLKGSEPAAQFTVPARPYSGAFVPKTN